MAKLDSFLSHLATGAGEALLLEGGNNIFLVNGTEMEALVQGRVVQNEHIIGLLKEIAPPTHHAHIAVGESTQFTYPGPACTVVVKTATRDGKLMARIKRDMTASADGPALSVQSLSGEGAPVRTPSHASPTSPPHASPMSMPSSGLAPGQKPRAEAWFQIFLNSRASDLHLTSGYMPMMRIDGDIKNEPTIPTLDADSLEAHLIEIMPARNKKEFEETNDTDFAYELPGARLRCNVFRDRRGVGAVFRKIPAKILSAKDLNLPQPIVDLGRLKKGLVLVTGPTGSGKSTTLAALVDWVNSNRSDHIITIEDPIEFVHEPKRCLIHQRQVGEHTQSFSKALRAALREDPDIVLVGEMRDLETVAIAIETAETGHLVFGTLHTTTAASTVDRIIDQFSADRQDQIRMMLAESLKGVVSQTLCKKKGGGRVAALEVLLVTTAVSNAIRERKTHQIPSTMQTSRGIGMRTLNDALIELVKQGLVTAEEAVDKSLERTTIIKEMRGMGIMVNVAE